jgi:small subunit ribosomal protein S8
MSAVDTTADMLTRIRNAISVRHETVLVPSSKLKVSIAKILKSEGFIKDYQVVQGEVQPVLKITIAYKENKEPYITGLKRVSKSGLRVYVGKGEIPRVYGGLGVAIISTPEGVMTGYEAWRKKIGGELLCYVW